LIIPLARTAFGLVAALLFSFLGDVLARVFNLLIGFPWDPTVHVHIQYAGIGIGAGLGAYLAWTNLERPWYVVSGSVLLVLLGGIGGAYLGRAYGPGVDQTYWWSRFATDTTLHLGAGILSAFVATVLGLMERRRFRSRLPDHGNPIPREEPEG
jgi:hypothetical protein